MSTPSLVHAQSITDRDLISSVVNSFYIVDYGFVTAVNTDGSVNVTHAKRAVTRYGKTLPEVKTDNVQVLTFSGAGFSLKPDVKKGDKVLLLGLKDYVEDVADIASSSETEVFLHYSRETMKALPLCVFNSQAKIQIELKDGDINLSTDGNITLKCKSFKVQSKLGISALEVTP